MKLLSLDLSTRSSGFSVLNNGVVVDYGTVKSSDKDFLVRGHDMAEGIKNLCEIHGGFDKVVVEELKVLTNQKVLVMLGIVQGMVLRELKDTPVYFVKPSVWRKPFGLNGKRDDAKKKAIAWCTTNGFPVNNDDEAEAILIGKFFTGHRG